jgi:acyl-CoA synthetase (AMP-forming)/AMP-acid ligase II
LTSNFAARIADAAARFAGETAIEVLRGDQVETTTYGALMSHAANFAGWLHAQGIGPGDRAAILSDNDASWIAAYLGLLRLGAVAVPLDTAYKAAQVATVVADSGAKVLFFRIMG